jgi:predicted  nucleic acid-binding Zn-ribbon protein
MSNDGQNGWNEYSRLVLKELESLNDSIEGLKIELQDVKHELTKMQAKEDKVNELRGWKERIDDVASPTQIRDLIVNVEDLKVFKTKAITIFAVVQFGMAAAMWLMKIME